MVGGGAGAGVCSHVCVCERRSEREGPVVFGRHCVKFILKKRQQQQQRQQEWQQSIQPVIRNNVVIAMKCGTVTAWINKEAAATVAFKSVMTLKGAFCQLVAVGACGHSSGGS